MERLTHRYTDGEAWASIYKVCACGENECKGPIIDRLAAYEDIGLDPEEVKEFFEDVESRFVHWVNKRYGIPAMKFMDIMQAEKDGRLVKYLPGDTVYDRFGREWTVTSSEIHGYDDGLLRHLYRCGHPGTDDYYALCADEIFTRAEAEAALERRKEEQHEAD